MNFTLFVYFLFSMETTLGVDYSGFDVGLKQRSRSIDCMKKCILEVGTDGFKLGKHLKNNTIANPLEIWESKIWEINKNILEASQKNENKIQIKGFETEFDLVSINSLYILTLVKDLLFTNLVVAARDYYTEDEMKSIGKMFSVRRETKVSVIPASLAFLINYKLATVTAQDNSLIVSTVGNKVVFNVYKTLKEKEKFTIENILSEVYDDVSDNKIREIILKNIKEQIFRHAKSDKATDFQFSTYPILDVEEQICDRSLDLLEVYEDVKNSVLSNHTSYTIRLVFINDFSGKTKKIPLLDIVIDVQKIIEDINSFLEPIRAKFENIVQNLKNTVLEKEIVLNSVYFITDFFDFFKTMFDLDGSNKVQNGFIKSGCTSFDKSKVELKNIKTAETHVFIENECVKIFEEIELKDKAKKIYDDVKEKGGLESILSELNVSQYSDLKGIFDNLTSFDLESSKKIVNGYNSLFRENFKVKKWKKERIDNMAALEKTLNGALGIEKSEPELWASGLDKHIISTKEWFDNSRTEESILGNEFELKNNMLEGYIQAFRNKLVRAKQEKEKKMKEEEEKKKQEEENKSKGDQNETKTAVEDKKDKEEPKETFTEKEVEEAKKLLENNEALPDMKDFDYEDFKTKFNELMKEDKYKKLMSELDKADKPKDEEANPDLESREL